MEDGYIAKIVVPSGAQDIQVGEVVAAMVEEAVDCAKFDYVPAAEPPPRRPAAPAAPAAPRRRVSAAPTATPAAAPPRPPARPRLGARWRGGGPRSNVSALPEPAGVMSDVARAIESGVAVGGASGAGAGAADGLPGFSPVRGRA